MNIPPPNTMAIRVSDLRRFGCPNCGQRAGTFGAIIGGVSVWQCDSGGHQHVFVITPDNMTNGQHQVLVSCDEKTGKKVMMKFDLQDHPQEHQPHGQPHTIPDGFGEYMSKDVTLATV